MKVNNLEGKKFGLWTVISRAGSSSCGATWNCICSCETKKIVRSSLLVRGQSKSCGCESYLKLPKGIAGFRKLYEDYKHQAKVRNYTFELTQDQFKSLTSSNCFYCKTIPKAEKMSFSKNLKVREHSKYLYNGIDRKNNNIGYIYENCVPCCKRCNFMKKNQSYEDFINHIFKIVDNLRNFK